MPRCEGPPNDDCPFKRNGAQVSLCQGDLMLCAYCNSVRFPIGNNPQGMVDQRVTRNSSVTVISAADASLTRNISQQNKDRNLSQSQKKDTPEVVQNELLCFVQNKMDIITQNMLVKSIVNFYTDSEIKEAKDMLFDKYGNKVSPSLKNCQHTGNGKSEKNVLDIYALLGRIPLDICPVYVAANLAKLPPLDPDNYDVMALSQQVNEVRKGMSEFNNIASLRSEVNDIKMQLNDLLAIKHQVSEIAHQLTMPTQKNQTNKQGSSKLVSPENKEKASPDGLIASPSSKDNAKKMKGGPPHSQSAQSYSKATAQSVPPVLRTVFDKQLRTPKTSQSDGFTVVTRKSRRPLIGTKTSNTISSTSTRPVHVFLSRISPSCSVEEVKKFVKNTFVTTDVECEKLATRFQGYSAFRVSFNISHSTNALATENWPSGVLVRKYFVKKGQNHG